MTTPPTNKYSRIIEKVFLDNFRRGKREVVFGREELVAAARSIGVAAPKNLGDVMYSFRYRQELPHSIIKRAPKGLVWIIRPAGQAKYKFVAVRQAVIAPRKNLAQTKVPRATPGVIEMYSLSDEQSLLAGLRYNRLIDIFTGVTCYSLQNHLRTAVPGVGQIETDEIYIGIDKNGLHYVVPVQAKGGRDALSVVQIEQDIEMCRQKFPQLVCRPIGAQFMSGDLIALFEFEVQDGEVTVCSEKHYRLVAPEQLNDDDLRLYRQRLS